MHFGLLVLTVSFCMLIDIGCTSELANKEKGPEVGEKSVELKTELKPAAEPLAAVEPILIPPDPPVLLPIIPASSGGGARRERPSRCHNNNECLVLMSNSKSETCEYQLDPEKACFGTCTPSDNCNCPRNSNGACPNACIIDPCEVGRCVEQETDNGSKTVTCLSANKIDLPADNPQSCNDDNECTNDGCEMKTVAGLKVADCTHTPINDPAMFCNVNGDLCTTGHCLMGECDLTTDAIVVSNTCASDEDCTRGEDLPGLTCVIPEGTCAVVGGTCNNSNDCPRQACLNLGGGVRVCSVTGEPCLTSNDCVRFLCVKPDPYCACSDGNPCTIDGGCFEGACGGGIAAPNSCSNDTDCGDGGNCFTSSGTCTAQINLSIKAKNVIGAPCNTNEECGGNEICDLNFPQSFCTCQSKDTCGNQDECNIDMCIDGTCVEGLLAENVCVSSNPCLAAVCIEEGCTSEHADGKFACITPPADSLCYKGESLCTEGVESDCLPIIDPTTNKPIPTDCLE